MFQQHMFFGAYSVLIHLLPGLALFVRRHFPPPELVSRISLLSSTQYGGEHDGSATFWWFLVAPFVFYATWQTAYWLIVQVNHETYRPTEAFKQCFVKGKCANMSTPSAFASMHTDTSFHQQHRPPMLYPEANRECLLQVCCQHYIKKHGYETSYSCLAKRAAKTNNIWNRIVRKGCKARRLCMFGKRSLVLLVASALGYTNCCYLHKYIL